jgi:hypothetical protein
LFAAVVLLMMGANSIRNIWSQLCQEINTEYRVHLVGLELEIYFTKMYGTTNINSLENIISLETFVD